MDFIQLNKDVRRQYKLRLKERNIGVTLRAPKDPIYLDIDKANAVKVLSILFDNVEKYAKADDRVIIEMYAQKGKMVYMMKNSIREDMKDQITTQLGAGLTEAKRIIQTEKGRLISSLDGDMFKVGILLDVAQDA